MDIDEMFNKFWWAYPKDLSKGKKGGKVPALKAFKKINPDETEFNRIMGNMEAQIKADRGDSDSYRWPFVSSYLNQYRFDDEIMAVSTKIETADLNECGVTGCNKEVHGYSFEYCSFHIPAKQGGEKREGEIAKAWEATGLDANSPSLVEECRKYCRQGMNKMINKTADNLTSEMTEYLK